VVRCDEKSLLVDTSINKKLKRISYATDITDVNLLKSILKNNEENLNKNNEENLNKNNEENLNKNKNNEADIKAKIIRDEKPIDNEEDKEYTNDELIEKAKIKRRLSLESLNSVNSMADVEYSQDSLQKTPY